MASRRGFVLVLVVGILGLLLLAGVGLLQVASELQGESRAIRALACSRLASASGMEYAASRLPSGGYPQFRDDAESRSDDWTCRESVFTPLERVKNPSYSHGEPWLNRPFVADQSDNDADGVVDEANEGDGIFEPSEAFVDRDGDGRFTPASGRLRGGAGDAPSRFLLRVRGADGAIPLNAGALWGDDLHGSSPEDLANGRPDCSDPRIPYHLGLLHVLNNLGAVLAERIPARMATRYEKVPTGSPENPGDPWRISWLGEDLITRRPAGGYRSMAEVRNALRSAGYEEREIENVVPFLELGPYDAPHGTGRWVVKTREPYYPYAPIGLVTAPPEALEACWRYLFTYAYGSAVPGEMAGWQAECSRTGQPGVAGTLQYGTLFTASPFANMFPLILYPDEAEALARFTVLFRQQGSVTWKRYFEWLSAKATRIFKRDCDELANDGFPENAFGWGQAKMELAFWAVSMDPPLGLDRQGAATWATWGMDRDGDPANGVQPGSIVGFYDVVRALMPAEPDDPNPWSSGACTPFNRNGGYLRPQGLTVASPVSFRVVSWGTQGGTGDPMEGVLRVGERLDFASQEDFESHASAAALASRGVRVHDPVPQTRREILKDDMGTPVTSDDRTYPHVASLPRFNKRAVAPLPQSALPPYWGYSRGYGALSLATREAGLRKAGRYWSFSEDFDQTENVLFPPGPSPFGLSPNRELWPEPPAPAAYRATGDFQVFAANPDSMSSTNALKACCRIGDIGGATIQCPGLDAGSLVQRFAVECWMSPSGNLWELQGKIQGQPLSKIVLTCGRSPNAAGVTTIDILCNWAANGAPARVGFSNLLTPWTIPDEGMDRVAWDHHVAILVECSPAANTTTFRLFVNGSDEVPGFPGMKLAAPTVPGVMKVTQGEALVLNGVDELRLYGPSLSAAQIEQEIRRSWEMERYVRLGSFTSPTYVFEEGKRRPDRASWLGFVPPAFYQAADLSDPVRSGPAVDSEGRPVQLLPIIVYLDGYSTRPGDSGHPTFAPGFPKVLPYDQTTDLRQLGEVRSFRYRVLFDAVQVAGVLDDTPVFESIWLTFSRPDRPVSWHGWSGR